VHAVLPSSLLFVLSLGAVPSIDDARNALSAGAYSEAVELASEIVRSSPGDVRGYILRGLAELALDRSDDARKSFRRATELAPDLATAWFNYGTACFESRHFKDAEAAFLRASFLDRSLRSLAMLNAGFSAAHDGRVEDAKLHLAVARDAMPKDDAALLKKARDLEEAIQGSRDIVEQKRQQEKRAKLHDLILSGRQALESGQHDLGRKRLQEAMVVARSTAGGEELESQLADLLKVDEQGEEDEESDFTLELSLGGGWDSNVPQSGVVIVEPTVKDRQSPSSPLLALDARAGWRPWGTAKDGAALSYTLSQIAYGSSTVDSFSVQEHQLKVAAIYTPQPWLSLEALGEAFFVFAGVRTFAPFQMGASVGPAIIAREGGGFETTLKYVHTFKSALATGYEFLSGGRDEASIQQSWENDDLELSIAYLLRNEAVGVERIPVTSAVTTDLFAPDAIYQIPYSFLGHEASITARVELPLDLSLAAALVFERRVYGSPSFISVPSASLDTYFRSRIDHRYTAHISLERDLIGSFGIEASYTVIANLSTIDDTNRLTFLDYDDKNYTKQIVQLAIDYTY
jgi:Flp pilus assembly protein TadD